MEGSQIGAYRIERTLGAGGFGVVYVGVDVRLGRRAAIKQLLPELSGQRQIVERFFNEAKAAASINHPGIVEIYDVGWHTDGSAYFAMKLLDGDTLGKRLRKAGPMPVPLAATIARQVSSALSAAHARGIIHRDLKPDNIILVDDDEVSIGERATVLDFGIAKLFGDGPESQKTRTGTMMGTPAYMSPEQCRGAGEVDHRTDVYALGCILFEMLAGRPPFVGDGMGEILGRHQFVPPPALRGLRPDISPEFEAIVMCTLAKDPAERFSQMSELAAALKPFTTGGREVERPIDYRPPVRMRSDPVLPIPPAPPRSEPPRPEPGVPASAPPVQPSTLSGGRGERLPTDPRLGQSTARSGRRGVVLGVAGIVVLGAVIAVGAVLSSDSPEPLAPADAEPGASPVAAAIRDGKQALADRRWQDATSAARSALAIEPHNADAVRIADTARSEGQSEAAMRALSGARDQDPARAKAALAAIPESSVYYPQARIALESLVADYVKVVTKQAQELAAARKCKQLGELAQLAAGLAVAAREAVEAVKCTGDARPEIGALPPPTPCNFDEPMRRGDALAATGSHAGALAAYEQALRCKSDERIFVKAYMSACNGQNAVKAKVYFKRLPPARQGQLSQVCVRNGIALE